MLPFHLSFWPSGITTSLTSGMPRRDTCTMLPDVVSVPAVRVVVAGRLAVDQTPMIGLPERTDALGTWIAMLWTLKPASVSVPVSDRFAAVEEVEDAQIEEERVVGLAGEDAADRAVGLPELVDAAAVAAVVRRRCRPDVVVHRPHRPGGEDGAAALDAASPCRSGTGCGSDRRAP